MINYCLALPYLPGGAELAKKFVQENGNTKEHDEFYRIAGISNEHVWIQPIRITNPKAKRLPKSYISCTEFEDSQFKAQKSPAD
jgi:hypothetical protein